MLKIVSMFLFVPHYCTLIMHFYQWKDSATGWFRNGGCKEWLKWWEDGEDGTGFRDNQIARDVDQEDNQIDRDVSQEDNQTAWDGSQGETSISVRKITR